MNTLPKQLRAWQLILAYVDQEFESFAQFLALPCQPRAKLLKVNSKRPHGPYNTFWTLPGQLPPKRPRPTHLGPLKLPPVPGRPRGRPRNPPKPPPRPRGRPKKAP